MHNYGIHIQALIQENKMISIDGDSKKGNIDFFSDDVFPSSSRAGVRYIKHVK